MVAISPHKLSMLWAVALPLLLSQASAQATLATIVGAGTSLTSLAVDIGSALDTHRSVEGCFSGGSLKGGIFDCSDIRALQCSVVNGLLSAPCVVC